MERVVRICGNCENPSNLLIDATIFNVSKFGGKSLKPDESNLLCVKKIRCFRHLGKSQKLLSVITFSIS